jgi:hypothetical protein
MNDNPQVKKLSWRTELNILTANLKVTLPANDPNRYNYRIDTLGAESEYRGFATVIVYLQLSEKVDSIQAQYLIREISRLHSRGNLSRFLLFFFNNPDGNLKYLHKWPTHEDHATALIRKAYKDLQPAESKASKQLNQLTPKDTLIFNQELCKQRRDKNLYVIIHDNAKVSLSEQVLTETEGFRKRFITACIEKEDTIKLARFDNLLI